jgi:hypothetical protein
MDRITRYATVSTALALLSDARLAELLDGAAQPVEIAGTRVFVKRVPLTDLERLPGNVMSTANLFGLPPFLQWGVGSVGFGAWRELAANVMATNWVLAGETEVFPLLYGWRVLPGAAGLPGEYADIDKTVAYWAGSGAVRERLSAMAAASASLVLFLEHVPQHLDAWLHDRAAAGQLPAAIFHTEQWLREAADFLDGKGLAHFDLHFHNLLSDGERLYVADLGLASTEHFELSADEVTFLRHTAGHDTGYCLTHLVNWLLNVVLGISFPDREAFLREWGEGGGRDGVPDEVAAILDRYADLAATMTGFYRDLFTTSRTAEYPADDVRRDLAALGRL